MKHPKHQEASGAKPQRPVVPEGRQLRKRRGIGLKQRRADVGLSQVVLAERLGMKYYTFISQVENGFSRFH